MRVRAIFIFIDVDCCYAVLRHYFAADDAAGFSADTPSHAAAALRLIFFASFREIRDYDLRRCCAARRCCALLSARAPFVAARYCAAPRHAFVACRAKAGVI